LTTKKSTQMSNSFFRIGLIYFRLTIKQLKALDKRFDMEESCNRFRKMNYFVALRCGNSSIQIKITSLIVIYEDRLNYELRDNISVKTAT